MEDLFRQFSREIGHGESGTRRVMPGVHTVASLLKRWLRGTHQGSVTATHLDAYLDEFALRFNRR